MSPVRECVCVCVLFGGLLKDSCFCVAYLQRERVSYADGTRRRCLSGLWTGSLCNFPSFDPTLQHNRKWGWERWIGEAVAAPLLCAGGCGPSAQLQCLGGM